MCSVQPAPLEPVTLLSRNDRLLLETARSHNQIITCKGFGRSGARTKKHCAGSMEHGLLHRSFGVEAYSLECWLSRCPCDSYFPDRSGSTGHLAMHFKTGPTAVPLSVFADRMPHMENTSVLHEWLQETRSILDGAREYFHGQAFTPLAILWESDPHILKCTLSNLLYALVAIVMVG